MPADDDPTGSDQVTVTPVWLDEFREADLDDLLIERSGDEITGGYLPGQLGMGQRDWLRKSLDRVLPLLGEKLMGPLAANLRVGHVARRPGSDSPVKIASGPVRRPGPPRIVLIPTGRLSLLPLHAARYEVDGREVCFVGRIHGQLCHLGDGAGQGEAGSACSERHRTSSGRRRQSAAGIRGSRRGSSRQPAVRPGRVGKHRRYAAATARHARSTNIRRLGRRCWMPCPEPIWYICRVTGDFGPTIRWLPGCCWPTGS